MAGFWTQFAHTGNPNAAGGAVWPVYAPAGATYLSLPPGAIAPNRQFSAAHKCAFWTPGV
ncbi:MAG: carboxylesterase family protein [Pseudomonadota bacterium]|nr:carboxylesterase family protein [Pseudomonadota bacterium]